MTELKKQRDNQEKKLEELEKRLMDMHSQHEEEIKRKLYQQILTLCEKNCANKHEVVGHVTERLQEIIQLQRQDLMKAICKDIKCINQEQHQILKTILDKLLHSKQQQFQNVQFEQHKSIELAIQNGVEEGIKKFFKAHELEITKKGADKCINLSDLDSLKPSSPKYSIQKYPNKCLEWDESSGGDKKRLKTGIGAGQQGSSHFMSPNFTVSKPFRNKMWDCKTNPSPIAAIMPRVKGSIYNGNAEGFLAKPFVTVASKVDGTCSNIRTYNKPSFKNPASEAQEWNSTDNCDNDFTAYGFRKRSQPDQTPMATVEQSSTIQSKDETVTPRLLKDNPNITENFCVKDQLQLVTCGNSDSEEAEDDDSQRSSPAMAVMEVVIKRKVQERRTQGFTRSYTPYKKSPCQLGNDFLSSPNFSSESQQETSEQDMNCFKEHPLDENSSFISTEVVDIRQYIKRQTKPKKR